MDDNLNRKLSAGEVLLLVAALLVFLVPLFLLTVFSDVRAVQIVLGNGRVFIIWIALAILLGLYRRRFDEYFEKRFGIFGRRKS